MFDLRPQWRPVTNKCKVGFYAVEENLKLHKKVRFQIFNSPSQTPWRNLPPAVCSSTDWHLRPTAQLRPVAATCAFEVPPRVS